jgi:hypothetical protein
MAKRVSGAAKAAKQCKGKKGGAFRACVRSHAKSGTAMKKTRRRRRKSQ